MKNHSWLPFGIIALALTALALLVRDRLETGASAAAGPSLATVEPRSLSDAPAIAGTRNPVGADPETPGPGSLEGDDLVDRLRRIAVLELGILRLVTDGDDPDATGLPAQLEETLLPILREPASLETVLAMLRAGVLAASGPDGAPLVRLSEAEHGAVRALFYGLLAYREPPAELAELGPRADPFLVVREILAALPHVRTEVRDALVENLLLACQEGGSLLDRTFLADLLFLQAQFPELAESVALLLGATGEALTSDERDALFAVLAPDATDPALVALALGELLRGSDPELALAIGARRFDDPAAAAALRSAVATVIARDADEYAAARFLAERADETQNMHEAWYLLGKRPAAAAALDAEYSALAAVDADPKAREMLVNGLFGARDERLLAIASDDPHPAVRGQALLTLTARPEHAPDADFVAALREHVDSGATHVTKALLAAGNAAQRARTQGRPRVRDEAVALLRDVARDAALPARTRRTALAQLRSFLSTDELQGLANAIEPGSR